MGGIGEGTGHFRIAEGICPLLSLTLSETTEDMFSCDVAQIPIKPCQCSNACCPGDRKMKRTMKLVIYL